MQKTRSVPWQTRQLCDWKPENCVRAGIIALGLFLLVSPGYSGSQNPIPAAQLYHEAQDAMSKGEYGIAIQDYRQLVRVNDHSAPLFLQLGIAQYQAGDYESAVRSLTSSVSLDGGLAPALAFLGLSEATAGHPDAAVLPLQKAFARGDQLDPELYRIAGQRLGRLYSSCGRQADAELVFSKLLQKYPDNPDVVYENFWFRLAASRNLMRKLLETAPDSYRTHQMLGYLLMQRQSYSAAAQQFRNALNQNPEALGLHYEIGNILLITEPDGKAASQEFREELRLHPRHAPSCFRLGELALRDRDYDEATRWYELTLKNDPRHADALVGLAKIAFQQEHPEEALHYAEQSIRIAPNNRFGHYILSRVYRVLGRKAEAENEIAQFRQLEQKAAEESQFLASAETGGSDPP